MDPHRREHPMHTPSGTGQHPTRLWLFLPDHLHNGQGGINPSPGSDQCPSKGWEDSVPARSTPSRLIMETQVETIKSRKWVMNGENLHIGRKTFVPGNLFSLAQGLYISL